MRIFLAAGAALAAAVLVACEKNEETSGRVNPQANPYELDPQHQFSFRINNPLQLYQNLGQVLLNNTNVNYLDAVTRQQVFVDRNISTGGLNAHFYSAGPRESSDYSDLDANRPWSNLLHHMEGARYILSGTFCPRENPLSAPNCFKIDPNGNLPQPRFDTVDDHTNLTGLFFFLQLYHKAGLFNGNAHCEMVVATLGNENSPFCSMAAMHNILLTPHSVSTRFSSYRNVEGSFPANIQNYVRTLQTRSQCMAN